MLSKWVILPHLRTFWTNFGILVKRRLFFFRWKLLKNRKRVTLLLVKNIKSLIFYCVLLQGSIQSAYILPQHKHNLMETWSDLREVNTSHLSRWMLTVQSKGRRYVCGQFLHRKIWLERFLWFERRLKDSGQHKDCAGKADPSLINTVNIKSHQIRNVT